MNYRLLIDYEVIEFLETFPAESSGVCATGSLPSAMNRQNYRDYTEP